MDYLSSMGKSLTVDTLKKMLSLFFGAGAVCVLGPLLVASPAVPGREFEELGYEGWQSSGQLGLGREGSCYPQPLEWRREMTGKEDLSLSCAFWSPVVALKVN